MQRDEDDDAWRAIIENYGERAELPEDPFAPPADPDPGSATFVIRRRGAEDPGDLGETRHPDAFVAPDPPLPPAPTRDRQLAWLGLIGSPIVLLVCLVASVRIPSLLAAALVLGFVGGFGYLVFHLPRANDDPFDDGARV